ncbi:hypothetical protein C2E23DRAFT_839701 [Lenzites betulinus]|nr:hypothetical protein C2E23DRAFT_839701 [Lenzites betulinus]
MSWIPPGTRRTARYAFPGRELRCVSDSNRCVLCLCIGMRTGHMSADNARACNDRAHRVAQRLGA